MRRIPLLAAVGMAFSAAALPAQSIWNTSARLAPQFQSYDVKTPFNEKVSQFAVPFFVTMPVLPALTIDVGTAFASATLERQTVDASNNPVTVRSEMSGLTDTQLRLNYAFGQDFVVVTAGVNIPTGSATVDAEDLEAATRIGSDFLMFPISGFGSGFGLTGGVAVARPVGNWNLGAGASVRHSSEYEPFRDASGVASKFQPGPEYRARIGVDHPFGTGRISFGLTFSQYGDDKANTTTFNTGSRYIGQVAISNQLRESVDYSVVLWNMYRTSGTLINQSPSPSGNITNALVAFAIQTTANISIEPSIETRFWTQQGSKTSYLGTFGTRLSINRGAWAIVPGFGFSMGSMEAATLTGLRGMLGIRLGG
jgi:hypothetical protein